MSRMCPKLCRWIKYIPGDPIPKDPTRPIQVQLRHYEESGQPPRAVSRLRDSWTWDECRGSTIVAWRYKP